jgi:CheY-like chemotaxis protein
LHSEIEKKKILVVDDELEMRIFLCNLLGTCGFASIDAANEPDGLQKARAEKPDLIILDAMMPGESGIQMYRKLQQDETLKRVPVIMLSSIDRKTFRLCQKYQCIQPDQHIPEPDAYLEKPPETEELLRYVHMLIEKGETNGECGS